MNRLRTNISLFLSVILITGTITLSFSSFMINAQAQQSYNNNYKSKDSNVSINKIKCINDNININGINSGDVNAGNNRGIAEGNLDAYSSGGYDNNEQGKDFDCIIDNDNDNNNTNIVTGGGNTTNGGGNQTIPNPKITVFKEMFICSEPTVQLASSDGGRQTFRIFCGEPPGFNIPDPDSPVWIPWEDCSVTDFCERFSEENFTMQIQQNSSPELIEFPGTSQGQNVNVQSGNYQIIEVSPESCPNPSYNAGVQIVNNPPSQPSSSAIFCVILEGECSGTIEAGEEKTCTVKNYFRRGNFQVPIEGLTAPNINTDTSEFRVTADSPIIAQETVDLSAMEKITKLKQQWMELTP